MNEEVMRKKIITALIFLGFTTILSQLILIRELLNVFQGNELIIGLILCIWMLLTAAGSRFGQRFLKIVDHRRLISRFFMIAGILPTITIFLLYILEIQLFPPGTAKGLIVVFIFCMGLLLPFCMASGILFTLLASILSGISRKNRISQAYGWESAGSTIAGMLFSLCLVYLLRTFQVLALVAAINLLVYFMLFPIVKQGWRDFIIPGIFLILSVIMMISPADRWVKSFHFKNQRLVYTKDTPYGNIAVTLTAGQYNFYENGALLFSTENHQMNEESVHYTLLQHTLPEKILVVSGGIIGIAKQALKYRSIRSVDYFEINPWMVKAERRFSDTITTRSMHILTKDARRWIKKSPPIYDAIIVNTPDPMNAQVNRYYTVEFFQEAKRALRPHGVFSISLSPTVNYMSSDARDINRVIYQSLKNVFRDVEVIPGERNYFIASQDPIQLDIANRIQLAGIENEYVNQYYIEDELLKQNSRQIMDEITVKDGTINTDLAPLAYFLQIRYWLNKFQEKGLLMIILSIIIVLMMFVLRRISPVAAGVFTGGFAGASTEFLILIIIQILYGYVYQMLGIIIAFYMIGLTLGTIIPVYPSGKIPARSYLVIQFIMILLVLLIPLITIYATRHNIIPGWVTQAFLFTVTAAIALAAGLEFNMASNIESQKNEKVAGNLYGVDLAGAAGGTLLTSLFFFPLLGLWYTCLVIALLILASIIMMVISMKKYT
jgi:spermidine synthase